MTGHRRMVVAAMAGAVLIIAACGNDVAANDVEVGQCSNQDLTGSVGEIDTVDCEDSHTLEVFAVYDVEGNDFPGVEEITAEALEGCTGDRFEDYVGVPYAESDIFYDSLAPNEQTWNEADDRTVICFAVSSDRSATEGSVKDANR